MTRPIPTRRGSPGGQQHRVAGPLVNRASPRLTREPVWIPEGEPVPEGMVPTTGPQGQPHDQRDAFDELRATNADTGMTDKEEEDYEARTGLEP